MNKCTARCLRADEPPARQGGPPATVDHGWRCTTRLAAGVYPKLRLRARRSRRSVADEQLPTRITQWRADDDTDIDGFDHDALDAPDEMLTLTQYAQRATILHDHGSLGCSDRDDVELIDRHERTRR